jgi:hypothetical protein
VHNRRAGFGRRTFLRGVGGVILGVPFLEALQGRGAYAAPSDRRPSRFLLFFHHQGTVNREWVLPGTSEDSFTHGSIAQPLGPYRSRMLYVRGLDNKIAALSRSDGHNASERSLFTANVFTTAVDGQGRYIPRDAQAADDAHAAGPSIDQVLADRLYNGQPNRSIDLSVGGSGPSRLLYRGASDPVSSEGDPRQALARLFSDSGLGETEALRLMARRQSVLDAVQENFRGLCGKVGQEDCLRLEAHADKIRDLERRVTSTTSGSGCGRPVLNLRPSAWRTEASSYDTSVDDETTAIAHIDILTTALACDLAPVGTLLFRSGQNPAVFNRLTTNGPSGGPEPLVSSRYQNWHDMVHRGRNLNGGSIDEPGLVRGYRWYSERFAELLGAMGRTETAAGTLLDDTMVLWMSEFGNGNGHNNLNLHCALAGNLGAGASTGRCLSLHAAAGEWDSGPYATNQLFVSALQAFGFGDQRFGFSGDGVSAGPLPRFAG